MSPTSDLSFTGLDEFVNEPVVENSKAMSSKEEPKDQGVIDSGSSRHMTGNMSYLIDYEEIDGGYVAFGGNSKAEKVHQEKVQQEKLKAVKARLNFEETSCHFESGTPIKRRGLKERLGPRHVHSRSESPELRHDRLEFPKKKSPEKKQCSKDWKKVCFTGSETRERVYPYTQTTQGVSHTIVAAKTLKVATKTLVREQRSPLLRGVIPREHPQEERRSCQKVKAAREVTGSQNLKEFVRRYKLECKDVKGAPECMKISGFMHGITNPELIMRLHDKILKSVDEMMRVTTAFLRGEVAASNHERKKPFSSWKQQEANQKQNFKKGGHRNQQRSERKHDRFSLLIKTLKEIFALDKGKFKASPPMTTPVEKQNHAKFCEFHGEVGHNTDECMHLKKQIEEMLKAGKLTHLIKELKQNNGKEQPKVTKKGETSGKDKALAILMVQPWEMVARQRITQSFSPNLEIFFPPLGEDEGTEGPMIIEAEIGGHCVHRMKTKSQKLQAFPSTALGMLKIPVEGGVVTLKSSKLVPLECAAVFGPKEAPSATKLIIEERIKVAINPEYPEQTVMIGSTLTEEGRNKLCGLLQRNLDIFAWKPADMTGLPIHIAEHRLNVREGCSLVRQKKIG
ncbi:hypothetical protein Tco_1201316 [Tanacetum coccineum]